MPLVREGELVGTAGCHSPGAHVSGGGAVGEGVAVTSVSAARWWVLGLFSAWNILQGCSFNFYGPISAEIVATQGWTLNELAWVENSANIAMLFCVPIMGQAVSRSGNRGATLVCAVLLFVCTALRCGLGTAGLPIAFVAMLCNGASAAWLNSAGPVISATWFPPLERGLATALVSVSPPLGNCAGFILGPFAVRRSADPALGINTLCVVEAGMAMLLLLATLVYFPGRPQTPPSLAAAIPGRVAVAASFPGPGALGPSGGAALQPAQTTMRAWFRLSIVAFVTAVPLGVFNGWMPILAPSLAEFGVDEIQASWMGSVMTLATAAGGLSAGWLTDMLPGRLKAIIVVCLLVSAASFTGFALAAAGRIPGAANTLFATGMVGSFFVNGLSPLGFELAAETAYPNIPEAIAAALLSFLNTFIQILFLSAAFLPSGASAGGGTGSSAWMSWLLAAVNVACVLPLACFHATYPRLRADGVQLGRH